MMHQQWWVCGPVWNKCVADRKKTKCLNLKLHVRLVNKRRGKEVENVDKSGTDGGNALKQEREKSSGAS